MGGKSSKQTNDPNLTATGALELSKQLLDFGTKDEICPTNSAVTDEIELKNTSKKKITFKFEPVAPPSCQLSFSPSSGSVDKGKSKKIKAKLVLLTPAILNFKVTLRIDGGPSLFINLRVSGESGVYGVDPMTLDLTEDNGYRVPSILVGMKNCILKNNGVNVEGLFRLAGEQTEIIKIKDLMNKKTFDFNTKDVNTIASLLKIWFRDLPVPILNALPQEFIMNWADPSECVAGYQKLPEPQKSLLDWLLDLLVIVAANSHVNKMTSQNLAIVIAPNLYDISTPNPMEGLILSQKCAQFLNHVLNAKIAGQF